MNSAGGGPPIRMIATDIDGTMLRSDGTLSPRVRTALRNAHEAGLHVVPATGRPFIIAGDVIEALGVNEYWVFANGAITRHLGRDELIRGFWMDAKVTKRLVAAVRSKLPDAGFALEFEKTVAFEPGFADVVPIVPDVEPSDDVLEAFETGDPLYRRVQKILVYDTASDIDSLYRDVKAVVGTDAFPSYSGLAFIELAAGLVTKATALKLLAEDLGVAPAEVVAFGDNHNDLPMLQWAGRSYAMANATDDAKETADEVIGSSDDDGLAEVVEQILAEL